LSEKSSEKVKIATIRTQGLPLLKKVINLEDEAVKRLRDSLPLYV
jgi:hypothetical protein